MSATHPGTTRTSMTDERIRETIGVFEKIISVLKEVIDDGTSFTESCRKHNLETQETRSLVLRAKRCEGRSTEQLSDFMPFMYNGYEEFYNEVFGTTDKIGLPFDYKESVDYVLSNTGLEEREIDMIKRRFGIEEYAEKATLQSIGDAYELTRDRVRQILDKACRKCRHPSRFPILMKGISAYRAEIEHKMKKHMDDLERIKSRVNFAYSGDIASYTEEVKAGINDMLAALGNTKISILMLPAAKHDAIVGAGIDSLLPLMSLTVQDLKTIRGVGYRGAEEIAYARDVYIKDRYGISSAEFRLIVDKMASSTAVEEG